MEHLNGGNPPITRYFKKNLDEGALVIGGGKFIVGEDLNSLVTGIPIVGYKSYR